MMIEESLAVKMLNALKPNAIKILLVLDKNERVKWKEMQELTGLPTATLNRTLSYLQESNIVSKENGRYMLTWIGAIVINRLILFGLKMNDYPDESKIEKVCSEDSLAQDISLSLLANVLAALKLRRELDVEKLNSIVKEKIKIIQTVLQGYEKEGYITVRDGRAFTTKKYDETDLKQIF